MPKRENKLADWGLWALSDPWLSKPKPRRERNAAMVKRRTWGQYSSLTPSPAHLSHTTTITFSRIKCERLYFHKEVCSSVHWSSYIMFDYVSAYICICIMWLYNTTSYVRNRSPTTAVKWVLKQRRASSLDMALVLKGIDFLIQTHRKSSIADMSYLWNSIHKWTGDKRSWMWKHQQCWWWEFMRGHWTPKITKD